MAAYTPPLRDMAFVLHDVARGVESRRSPATPSSTATSPPPILEEAGRIARDVLAPLNAVGDREGCRLENGVVRTPDGLPRGLRPPARGRLDRPRLRPRLRRPGHALRARTPPSARCTRRPTWPSPCIPGLTHGAYSAIHAHGTEEQKATYLPKLVTCEWTGTMNLTEPHAGTDLGLLRTSAEPQDDGSYRITGQKIFISAGDHDLAENIVHLVLARITGAPAGVKGISLFIVPKFLVNADGSPRRAQRRLRRQARGEDGHPRQRHLRDELRRRHRLAPRRGERAASTPCSP